MFYQIAKAILPRLTTLSKAENWGRFFMSHPV